MALTLSHEHIAQSLNKFAYYIAFKKTELGALLQQLKHKTIGNFSGNQGGKTAGFAKHYVDRLLGIHPVAEKNRLAKKIRCMSSSLPENDSPEEQDNTQYLELKKLIPPELVLKDVTARSKNLVVRRPVGLSSDKTVFEFRSSKQEMQDLGKIQLSSVWHDEETPKGHREECKMRLLAESGDELFSLTPTNALSYTFDDVWQRADFIYRTKTIVNKFGFPRTEHRKNGSGIACVQMATDDNPTLDPDTIERLFEDITDPDELAIRRYGVFKQISGRIHKSYDPAICYIDFNKYFPDGVPYKWLHARGIDYHESRIPWSIGWLSASPEDEWFLWQEFHPAIDGSNAYSTYDIVMAMLRKSGDYYYIVNLIDPLANKTQSNTNTSVTQDINRHFQQIRRETGLGTDAMWQGWDTKGTKGRDEVAKRFKNASRCGVPFNNAVKDRGTTRRLPTLWVCNTCPKTNKSLINWRFGEHVLAATKATNDPKMTPQPKWSHDCMVLECLAKDRRLTNAASLISNPPRQMIHKNRSITGR